MRPGGNPVTLSPTALVTRPSSMVIISAAPRR